MKRFFATIAALGLLFSAPACFAFGGAEPSAPYARPGMVRVAAEKSPIFRTLTPREAQAMLAKRKDLLLIDVRGPEELREGFIVGSQLVPFTEIAKGRQSLPFDRPLLLICAVGGRSLMVGQYLSFKGHPEVYNLEGGIDNWKKTGLPLQYR